MAFGHTIDNLPTREYNKLSWVINRLQSDCVVLEELRKYTEHLGL